MGIMLMWTVGVRQEEGGGGMEDDIPMFQVFHICLPIEDNEGVVIETKKWSFFCGNATVFDQQTLTCNHPEDAFPCAESPSLYGSVEFGKIPDSDY